MRRPEEEVGSLDRPERHAYIPELTTYSDFDPGLMHRGNWTLDAILAARAKDSRDDVFLRFPESESSWTYNEVRADALRIANSLIDRGMTAGDRVGVMLPNCPEFVLTWFGTALAGLVQALLHTGLVGAFLRHQLETVDPSALVVTPAFLDEVLGCGWDGSAECLFLIVGEEEDSQIAVDRLLNSGLSAVQFNDLLSGPSSELPPRDPKDPAALFYTSGTTGPAKAVLMSHSQMAFVAMEHVSMVRLDESDTYMVCNPLFHGNAQFHAVYPTLIAGGQVVLRSRFSASQWAGWTRDELVTVTNLMGVMTDYVWSQPPSSKDAESPLRCVMTVPIPAFADEFKLRFGVEALAGTYGMTEISCPIMIPYGSTPPAGSCGLLVEDWFEVQIVDPDTDEPVPPGGVGELLVRSKRPWTMSDEYFRMPQKTSESRRNLWFHTGDGMRRDPEGWFYFVDRLNDSIRRKGENVSSYEIEQTFLTHPDVAEAAAVAVKAKDGQEDEIAVFVASASAVEVELIDFTRPLLPSFSAPSYVVVLEELPKTPSGKVKKADLRALAQNLESGEVHV